MKNTLTTKYKYHVKKLLSSYLSGKDVIHGINIFAVSLLCYSAGLIKWALQELHQLDVKTRKLLSLYHAFSVNLTGFTKTDHNVTRTEIQIMP